MRSSFQSIPKAKRNKVNVNMYLGRWHWATLFQFRNRTEKTVGFRQRALSKAIKSELEAIGTCDDRSRARRGSRDIMSLSAICTASLRPFISLPSTLQRGIWMRRVCACSDETVRCAYACVQSVSPAPAGRPDAPPDSRSVCMSTSLVHHW